jgi:hypothetical protein
MVNSTSHFLRLVALLALVLIPATTEASGQVIVAWDATPDRDVAGYSIFYGGASGQYPNRIDVAGTQWTLTLPDGTHYIAVQAFTTSGLRSALSNELTVTVGASPAAPPTVPSPPPPPSSGGTSTAAARQRARSDFNGDGFGDILWQHPSGALAVWMLNGNKLQTVQSVNASFESGSAWQVVGTGDFNSDGKPDVLWQHMTEGWLNVWYMNGTTLISSVPLSIDRVADATWKVIGAGDFNGDGKPDVVWRNDDGSIAAWLMSGVTVSSITTMTPDKVADTAWKVSGVGDFDGDGKSDLLWRHDNGTIAVWLMNGTSLATISAFDPPAIDPAWKIASITDTNGDGAADIVWRRGDGYLALWYLNGTTLKQTLLMEPAAVADLNWKIVGPK